MKTWHIWFGVLLVALFGFAAEPSGGLCAAGYCVTTPGLWLIFAGFAFVMFVYWWRRERAE